MNRRVSYTVAYALALLMLVGVYSWHTQEPSADVTFPVVPQVERPVSVTTSRVPLRDVVNHARPKRKKKPVRTTTTTTAAPAPSWARCGQWWDEARVAGWPDWALSHVDYLMKREAACLPHVRSRTRDTGLMQINDVHLGWLSAHGISQASLYDPVTNLRAARLLYDRAQRMFGCGWQPWRTSSWGPC